MKTYILLLTVFSVLLPNNAIPQQLETPQVVFEKLTNEYHSGITHDSIYLHNIDSLTNMFISNGVGFEPNELIGYLKTYERIAWNSSQYKNRRFSYYLMLLNNARMFDHRGASIYYAEKATQEYKKSKNEKSWLELGQKLYIYSGQLNYPKIIETYEKERESLEKIPTLLKEKKVSYRYGMDALQSLSCAITAYASEKDSIDVFRTANLAYSIIEEIRRNYPILEQHMMLIEFSYLEFRHAVACFEEKYKTAQIILQEVEQLKYRFADVPTGFIDLNLIEWRTGLFMHLKNIDSAQYYLTKFEQLPYYAETQQGTIQRYKAQLELLKGNINKSREHLEKALEESAKITGSLVGEMDELMYAHTQAEHDRLLLEKSEQAKKQHLQWLVSAILLAIVAVAVLYYIMRKRERRFLQIIRSLNETADIQIALMEEAKTQVRQEAQQRFSRDLHDDLASTMLSIRNRTLLAMEEGHTEKKEENLHVLHALVEQAYLRVRNRSHLLHEAALQINESRFVNYIEDMATAAFPDNQYTYSIHLDPGCLANTSFEQRSELIRLLQEAFANILKHAKASIVDILLYQDQDNLLLEIKDNGRGFRPAQVKTGSGLRNMKTRTSRMGGQISIVSDTDGTLLRFSMPIASAEATAS